MVTATGGLLDQKRVQRLTEKRQGIVSRMEAILAATEDETFTDQQQTAYDALQAELTGVDASIEREQAFQSTANKQITIIGGGPVTRIGAVEDQWVKDPRKGYQDTTAFLLDVMAAGKTGNPSPQLRFLAAAGSDEAQTQSNSAGGFLIPTGLIPGVRTTPIESDPTEGLVTVIPMDVPEMSFNSRVDKNHSTQVGGGVEMNYKSETQPGTASKLSFEQVKFSLSDLIGISYASERILKYSPVSFAALLEQGFGESYTAKKMAAKLSGTGAGQPLGILNSDAKISVAKESGQTADTIVGLNLVKMRARIYSYNTSIWLANPDCLVSLTTCHLAMTNSDQPLFAPGNGTDKPDTLWGRPIYFTDHCKTVGDQGDIILANWSEYGWGVPSGGDNIRRDETPLVRFLENENTFRFLTSHDGQPMWKTVLTPLNSAVTRAPFVVLDARA